MYNYGLHLRHTLTSTYTLCRTATCWGFNFILSLTWPALVQAFTEQGAFGWYAAWNFFGWVYCYFLLPETKNLTLEELDTVFDVGNKDFARYYKRKLPWYLQKKILRRDVEPMEPLYELHDEMPDGMQQTGRIGVTQGDTEKSIAARV